MALPAAAALREKFPLAKISWLVRPEFAPILKDNPHLDQVIIFDRKYLGKAWKNPKALKALTVFLKKLRKEKFDAIFDFQGLFRTAIFGWISGAKKRFGMSASREFASVFYTDKIKYGNDCIHVVDYYLKMAAACGAENDSVEFPLPKDTQTENYVKEILNQNEIEKNQYAVFMVGSAHSDKCWPIDRFAKIADKLSHDYGLTTVAVGTGSELELIEKLTQKANVKIVNLIGKTNLIQLIEVIRKANVTVSNDTGVAHIAAALQKPVVVIFGRSNPARVCPYGKIQWAAAFEPKFRGLKADSDNPSHNVSKVTVEQVYEKICGQID